MKKRVLAVMLVAVMVVGLVAGCAKKSEPASSDKGKDDGEKQLKVALVVNQKFGDKASMDDLAKGADQAAEDFGVEIKKLESAEASKFEEDVRAMSKAGYDLIVTTYGYMTDATKLVSKEYPDTKYAAIFQTINDGSEKYENVWDTEFHGEGAFYLGGYIAGKLTKSNHVGFVVGAEEPTPNAEGNGFMMGVKAANPDATVEFSYVGSYEDPAKAKEITSAMISKGCDVIQTDSGASNAGVVEASKDAGILCAGEISDYYDTYEGFYGIEGIGFGDTVYKAIEMLKNGEYPGGEHGIRDLTNGGYFMDWDSFNRFADGNAEYKDVMKAAIEEAQKMEEQIKDGSLEVPFNTDVPNWDKIKASAE
ncbi:MULTISPECIES: BMP family ABC transporter substrate-binding protein [Clostridia]|uniref:BMP family ABC transporter substrate-binding protein n=1 Tax=Clostridia TaxID=186801 RepID=UPI001FA9485B|nr:MULTISPECIES: BMP family ABC transporter substrate-binding protein [Clostridia]